MFSRCLESFWRVFSRIFLADRTLFLGLGCSGELESLWPDTGTGGVTVPFLPDSRAGEADLILVENFSCPMIFHTGTEFSCIDLASSTVKDFKSFIEMNLTSWCKLSTSISIPRVFNMCCIATARSRHFMLTLRCSGCETRNSSTGNRTLSLALLFFRTLTSMFWYKFQTSMSIPRIFNIPCIPSARSQRVSLRLWSSVFKPANSSMGNLSWLKPVLIASICCDWPLALRPASFAGDDICGSWSPDSHGVSTFSSSSMRDTDESCRPESAVR